MRNKRNYCLTYHIQNEHGCCDTCRCRIWSLLHGSFAKETYTLKEPSCKTCRCSVLQCIAEHMSRSTRHAQENQKKRKKHVQLSTTMRLTWCCTWIWKQHVRVKTTRMRESGHMGRNSPMFALWSFYIGNWVASWLLRICSGSVDEFGITFEHIEPATHCTHCNHTAHTLQTHCNILQHTANTLQNTTTHCKHTAPYYNTPQ